MASRLYLDAGLRTSTPARFVLRNRGLKPYADHAGMLLPRPDATQARRCDRRSARARRIASSCASGAGSTAGGTSGGSSTASNRTPRRRVTSEAVDRRDEHGRPRRRPPRRAPADPPPAQPRHADLPRTGCTQGPRRAQPRPAEGAHRGSAAECFSLHPEEDRVRRTSRPTTRSRRTSSSIAWLPRLPRRHAEGGPLELPNELRVERTPATTSPPPSRRNCPSSRSGQALRAAHEPTPTLWDRLRSK